MRTLRNQRALAVIRNLRRRQKRQNQQIELLCQDMVQAHAQFSNKISRLSFVTRFYETLLGSSNIESLLDSAAAAIGARVSGSNVAIFLLEAGGFDIHFLKDPEYSPVSLDRIEGWFSTETVREISQSCQVCSASRMLAMGLAANPKELRALSLAAVPLGTLGQASGFILLWRKAEKPLGRAELETVASISAGLRSAIHGRGKVSEQEKNADLSGTQNKK